MSLKEQNLQGQLERAKAELSTVEKGLGQGTPKKNALWRRANARVNQIEGRLKARADLRSGAAADANEEASGEE
jgi:hypothetical protein